MDGVVSITDVTFLVNNILGITNVGEDEQNYIYDVNCDGVANVTDVTCLVNKILGILNPSEKPPSYFTCPDDHHPHFIDLGLPSGTKWACCNMGATKPEEYGGYYAWGETEAKTSFSWENYIHCEGSEYTCKYLGDDIACTEYDVAHVRWGGEWVMPSAEQFRELIHECTYDVDENGGRRFTASNGGSIFLPAAGCRNVDLTGRVGQCCYWTSTGEPGSWVSKALLGGSIVYDYRYFGYSVRPVICPK